MITYNEVTRSFYLDTENTSYVMHIMENGVLEHRYYGAKIPHDDLDYFHVYHECSFSPTATVEGKIASKDHIPQEMPTFGRGDFRRAGILITSGENGRHVSELAYVSHRICKGKPAIDGLPQFDANAGELDTLEITLADAAAGYEVVLSYTTFDAEDLIARHTTVRNTGKCGCMVDAAASVSLDVELGGKFDMLTLEGAWAEERWIERKPLHHGTSSIESRRGTSSHHLNPFAAFASSDANEEQGEVYGVALVYSADFQISAEVDSYGDLRVQAGIHPETFCWHLEPGESFTTPEAILTYSACGFGKMSRNFHAGCRAHLGRSADRSIRHPILINSWEAMYFDISEEKVRRFVEDCRGLGIDTYVMDDGWFGHRDSDNSSLGDWFVDSRKFPEGLSRIIDICHENGMNFGIWFEPEMISRDSELYRAHPDWCIHTDGYVPVESRQQLVLDFARPEVVDCIYAQMEKILSTYDISYVKWDMNRHLTDNGSCSLPKDRQNEHTHRYMLGVYALMQRITARFPQVFFEGCSGGGGRFDFGILYYMPQIWTSDDSDAIERLRIQYATSMVYPPAAMVAHVSACPNHQTGRTESFKTRGDVAQMCSFGYELNVGMLSEEERAQIKEQVQRHRAMEDMVNEGSYYRLRDPFTTETASWQLVSADQSRSFVLYAVRLSTANPKSDYLRLRGLDPDRRYRVEPLGITLSGATLMHAGLPLAGERGDFRTCTFDLTAE